jgi:hypothetical protein
VKIIFYLFWVCFSYIAAGSPLVTLPFDKGYIEALKGVPIYCCENKIFTFPSSAHFQFFFITRIYPDRSYYGGPTHECHYCGAVFWFQERVKSATANATRKIVYNLCCRGEKIDYKPYKKHLLY